MRNSWIEKYHQQHPKETPKDAFDAFIELSESPDIHFDENEAWNKLSTRLNLTESPSINAHRRSFLSTLYRVAAVITLLVISFVVYEFATDGKADLVTINTQQNPMNHQLPDGSTVYLDSYSSITYAEDFNDRILEFMGTGYYDVKKAGTTFTVKMGDLEVQVLGTIFMLETSASQMKAYVEEGKVQVSGNAETHKINPGDLLTYRVGDKDFTLSKNQDRNILSWKTGKFVFKQTTLPEVISNLEKYYKVEFQTQNNLGNCTVTAEFDQLELSEVLAILSEILDVKFSSSGSNVKILGKGC